jgi:ribose 5-phosphate isomerase B
MKIAIGSDHAGYKLKQTIITHLTNKGYNVEDFGTYSEESCDYPDYAHAVANSVENKQAELGILMCGSGNGITIAANKHQGIRAALSWDVEIAQLAQITQRCKHCFAPCKIYFRRKSATNSRYFFNHRI